MISVTIRCETAAEAVAVLRAADKVQTEHRADAARTATAAVARAFSNAVAAGRPLVDAGRLGRKVPRDN